MKKEFTIYYDEAWRWPLAWPMYIWLVCFNDKIAHEELEPFCDSKKISEKVREEHFNVIENLWNGWKIIYSPARVTATEIDKYWMTNSLHYAILRWMIQIFNKFYPDEFWDLNKYPQPFDKKLNKKNQIKYSDVLTTFSRLNTQWIKINLIMDWNSDFWLKKSFPFWSITKIVHWDTLEKWISMASIIAKVSRDRVMEHLPKKYDKYNFSKHKWYWTAEHKKYIEKYWSSDIHRKLFLKWIYPNHTFDKKLAIQF